MRAGPVCVFVLTFGSACAISFADAVEAPASTHADLEAQVDYILDHPLPESDYSRADRCLLADTYRSIEILDARHLLFLGSRGTVWLNQLRFECPGLSDDARLIFEMHDRSLCDMDGFRSEQRSGGPSGFGAHCMLGHFEPITEIQADLLRDALGPRTQAHKQKPPKDE